MIGRKESKKSKQDSTELNVYVVGVGGGGNNSIDRLSRIGVHGAKTVAVNTDKKHLQNKKANEKMLIGRSHNYGRGAGGNPSVGKECAESASGGFKKLFSDADLVFLTTGLGGGTGTGATPVITEIARRSGAMVIDIVTLPFSVEGNRKQLAWRSVHEIESYANSTIILENDKLLEVSPDMPIDKGFGLMDSVISSLVKSVTETITKQSLINLDFNDLRSVLGGGSYSTLMTGEAHSKEPENVVKDAEGNPFLNADYRGADKALIHLTGGSNSLSVKKMNDIVGRMTSKLDPRAGVIVGARIDNECKDKIKLMSIVTGLKEQDLYPFEDNNSISAIG
ncbi:MAG: cell division protein FtsZ [Candidatus Thermoplasmatota archaeon]|nr:cell division protein FtsZ [Candidatus Thermoplasmatota archaeon]MBS3789811.1 cell division protein FtsZ [Candidatus Thermoplasmatota archaeon]